MATSCPALVKPNQFDELAWEVILHEAPAEADTSFRQACAEDKILSERFDQMQREYQGLSESLHTLAQAQPDNQGIKIPSQRLEQLLAISGQTLSQDDPSPKLLLQQDIHTASSESLTIPAPAEAAATRIPAKEYPIKKSSSRLAWLGGAVFALVVGFLKIAVHEADQIAKAAFKTAPDVAAHEAGHAAKLTGREAAETEARAAARRVPMRESINTLEKIMAASQAAREKALAIYMKRVEAATAVLAITNPVAAKTATPKEIMSGELGLEFRITPEGACVTGLHANGPAETAGLKPGDVITRVDETDIRNIGAVLVELTLSGPPDSLAEVEFIREKSTHVQEIQRKIPPIISAH